jgi:beta-lactamase regulating signal transducer with metallopeptidase domain
MIAWILQTLIASSILMAIVLMLRTPVARAFGARAAYALWLLPVLRLILPPLPGWRMLAVPALYWGPEQKVVGLVDPATAVTMVGDGMQPASAQAAVHLAPIAPHMPPVVEMVVAPQPVPLLPGIGWAELLLVLWLGGSTLWFGWQMLRYRTFLAQAMRDARPLTRECGIDVLLSDRIDGPVAAGIVRRRIFLPGDFMRRYSPEERRLALVHEAAHHDRHDLQANLVGLAVLALHWWNPLAYRAYRAFRSDQELACDATVLADAGAGDRLAYGTAVLKSASARMPGVACALSHKAQLKQRIALMARKPIGASRLALGGVVAVAAIGGGLLLTASGTALAAQDPHLIEYTGPTPVGVAAQVAADRAERHAEAAGRRAEREGQRAEARGRHAEAAGERIARGAELRGDAISRNAELRADAMSRDADRRAATAEREAERVGREAALAGVNAEQVRRTTLAAVRTSFATQCAAAGTPVAASADWAALATCGQVRNIVRSSLQSASAAIASSPGLTAAERDRAMSEMDRSAADADHSVDL